MNKPLSKDLALARSLDKSVRKADLKKSTTVHMYSIAMRTDSGDIVFGIPFAGKTSYDVWVALEQIAPGCDFYYIGDWCGATGKMDMLPKPVKCEPYSGSAKAS